MDLVAPSAGLNYVDYYLLVVHLQTNWSKTKYSLLLLSRNASEDFLNAAKPPAGDYVSEEVGDNCFFVFQDRKQVCFITNVFPEHMDSKVFRMQPGGVLQANLRHRK